MLYMKYDNHYDHQRDDQFVFLFCSPDIQAVQDQPKFQLVQFNLI